MLEGSSVGHAWAVVKGRRSGNREAASHFLSSMDPNERRERNRQESTGLRRKARKRIKMGQRRPY